MSARGRPQFEITAEVCAKAERLAAQGLTLEQIARVLGISYQTLNEKAKIYSDFSEAIKNGKAKGIAKITNKLFQKAGEGDNTSMIFYLKNRDPDNWEEVQKRQVSANINYTDLTADELDRKIKSLEQMQNNIL